MMESIGVIVGYFILTAVALLVGSLAVSRISEAISAAKHNLTKANEEDIARRIGARLLTDDGWWFSEDYNTLKALMLLGERLTKDGSYDVRSLREEWRAFKHPNPRELIQEARTITNLVKEMCTARVLMSDSLDPLFSQGEELRTAIVRYDEAFKKAEAYAVRKLRSGLTIRPVENRRQVSNPYR